MLSPIARKGLLNLATHFDAHLPNSSGSSSQLRLLMPAASAEQNVKQKSGAALMMKVVGDHALKRPASWFKGIGWWHRDDFCIRSCNEVPLFCNGTHANGEISFNLGSWRLTVVQLPFWSSLIAMDSSVLYLYQSFDKRVNIWKMLCTLIFWRANAHEDAV